MYYQETHRFFLHNNVFALVPENGQIVITGARVMQCYRNAHGVYIYIVRRTSPGMIDYHLPRWLLFHHHEDAQFRRDHVFSQQDRNYVLDYATPHANSTMGQHLEFELVVDYVERFRNGNIPETVMVKNKTPGPTALGAPVYHLEVKSCEPAKRTPPTNCCNALQAFKNTNQSLQVFDRNKTVARNSFAIVPTDQEDSHCSRLVVLQPRNTYRLNHRKDFNDVVTEVKSVVMLRRLFDIAVEDVAVHAFSRMPSNSGIAFENLMQLVRNGE